MKYTRREIALRGWASCVAARHCFAAGYRDYSRCLPDYLTRLADEARLKRDRALSNLKNRAAIEERQAWARDNTFAAACSPFTAERPADQPSNSPFSLLKPNDDSAPGIVENSTGAFPAPRPARA